MEACPKARSGRPHWATQSHIAAAPLPCFKARNAPKSTERSWPMLAEVARRHAISIINSSRARPSFRMCRPSAATHQTSDTWVKFSACGRRPQIRIGATTTSSSSHFRSWHPLGIASIWALTLALRVWNFLDFRSWNLLVAEAFLFLITVRETLIVDVLF